MNGKTRAYAFNGNVDGANNLFSVNPGLDKTLALERASCAINSVKGQLDEAIGDNKAIGIKEAWLMRETLDAAEALVEACQ